MATRKSALVTGGTGFVGSNLVRGLVRQGWDTHVVVRAGSDASVLPPDTKIHRHDGSTGGLAGIVAAATPTVVFHLASLFLATHTAKDVEPMVASNLLFPTQLAQALAENRVRCLINAGTSWQHYEGSAYRPVCLYAATKQAFEDILAYYVDAEALRVVTLKLFDTYGPGDRRGKLLSQLARAAGTQETLLMSPGEQLLDLVYIDDVVAAFLAAAELVQRQDGAAYQEYGVSAGARTRLKDLVALYEKVSGRTLSVEWGARPYRAREVMAPYAGGRPVPGWRAVITLEEGIRRTLAGASR